MLLLSIAAAGFCGALARFWLGGYIAQKTESAFPWGTFAINISGAFALGLLTGLASRTAFVTPQVRAVFGTGLLGAYTTFSTWTLETVRLIQSGSYRLAALNVISSATAGLLAAGCGLTLAAYL